MKFILNLVAFLLGVATLFGLIATAFLFVPSLNRLTKHKLKTAEEVLATIDTLGYGYYPRGNEIVKLPPTELQKVIDELRERHPLVPLAQRLAYEQDSESTTISQDRIVMSPESREVIGRLEKSASSRDNLMRVASLEQLHGDEVESFINREGFGAGRHRGVVSQGPKTLKLRELEPSQFSGPVKSQASHFEGSTVELEIGAEFSDDGMPGSEIVFGFHERGLKNFAIPNRNGFIKDIDNVAGFEAHQLLMPDWNGSILTHEQAKSSDFNWIVNRVDLVSLLVHETPRVYVSDELPSMKHVKERETRSVSEFEQRGLDSLSEGEMVYYSAKRNRIEMIGAIRAGTHCLECHQGQRGKILGAFSYEILRSPQSDGN